MHIPDGFLANRVAFSLDAVSGAMVLYAARRVKFEVSARLVPIMGVLSAFVFAAQMLNFPVLGGTSGHLVGGALLAILLGPMAGFLTMTTVIVAQALFLQDGGLIAVGANVFNIGAVTAFSGFAVYHLLGGPGKRGTRMHVAGFLAGWSSLVLSSILCALELSVSGTVPLEVGLPAMAGYHALIGIAEGALTAGVLSFLANVRPDLLKAGLRPEFGVADWIGGIALVAIPAAILALAGSSELPDPLEALLSETPAAPGAATRLESPNRYWEYLVIIAVAVALAAAAYAVNRIAAGRRSDQ